ncbi:putative duf1446 domain-containing protein [Aspergillus arachidicola]|uniref:Putative duf1446 domain-containing protein n=1 Tax=Aspergillus arachidicola TaxID=656916 RepID=A0A2G7FNZ2_9EURO|nr:putative duf1446 domain-containing protein [Aspergillus arachidicola]
MYWTLSLIWSLATTAALAKPLDISGDHAFPIVNLDNTGRYRGTLENNGTVQCWKGIPYAEPPLGKLRFMPPCPLPPQSGKVINATTDPDRCVQFTLAPYGFHNSYLGPGSPGTEDCLKLYVWKPAKAKRGDQLPVLVHIHGGELIFGDGAQDDFSDWVGHDQVFIAVNMNYRLGMLGFMNHPDLPSANAGLLDQRLAMMWVKQNIAAFGGNPHDITIMGQFGGGWAIAAHLVLFDGEAKGAFQKAILRSSQQEPMFTTEELKSRNVALAKQLNCTGHDQLACFRNTSVPALVDTFQTFSTVIGTDGIFTGKIANVPTIAGSTTDEGFDGYINATQNNPMPQNTTTLDPSTNRLTNLTDSQVWEAVSFYPRIGWRWACSAILGFLAPSAQCYLGAWGIVEALNQGADIVLCGRVTDASPTIACAAYHYSWSRQDYSQLAHAFVAGHFIECSTYVTGGNFSGFKSLPGPSIDLGFPVVEIAPEGHFTVTLQKGKDGMMTEGTCKAQLLYEIQGPMYYNPDVVAILDDIIIKDKGSNRVEISNIKYAKPPPTTKIGITAQGGYQAEVHYFLCGLDITEKAKLLEKQIRQLLDESKYHTLVFRTTGSCPSNPSSQDAATVDVRIFAQSRDEEALSLSNFLRPCTDTIMQSYPGATFAVDSRQALAKPYYEYFVSIFPQERIRHISHIPFKDTSIPIDPPSDTTPFVYEQSSYESAAPFDLGVFGPTTRRPLGYVVHARSGDKGSDANVGFFVRHADEWNWLRTLLSTDKLRELLGKDDTGNQIFRCELPNIWAVHFLLKDHLDRGVSSSSTYDVLGKNVAEFLRRRYVDIPDKFLARGRI